MALGDGADEKESEAGAAYLRERASTNPIEALENAFQLAGRNPDAAVLHPQHQTFFFFDAELNRNVNLVLRVLDGVVQNV